MGDALSKVKTWQAAKFKPQPGPQTDFLTTEADIAVYGGAAGAGKTIGLLMEATRYIHVPNFTAVIFRRTEPEIKAPGGLWDTAYEVFKSSQFGGEPVESKLIWTFPSGAKIKFAHLQYDKNVYQHQGLQYSLICFDETTHFTEKQFEYLLSRNRNPECPSVRPYVRCTTNPSPGWLAKRLDWWIDDAGYPIPERSGVIKHMAKAGNKIVWGDSAQEVYQQAPNDFERILANGKLKMSDLTRTFTFIAANVFDNQILIDTDPQYVASLQMQSNVERERLLHGNWKIKAEGGNVFNTKWFKRLEEDRFPTRYRAVRFWDLAATKPSKANKDPDYTVGVRILAADGEFYIEDVIRFRDTPSNVEKRIRQAAERDGADTQIWMEQEPGASGVNTINNYAKNVLQGFSFHGIRSTGNKMNRANPLSAAFENGLVWIKQAHWNEDFEAELNQFPEDAHDDQVDAASGAFQQVTELSKSERALNRIRALARI